MTSVRAILAYLDRLEAVAPVKLGDVLDGCVFVGIAADPIDDVVYPAHSTPAGRTGQLADIGSEFPGAQIAEQRAELLWCPDVNDVKRAKKSRQGVVPALPLEPPSADLAAVVVDGDEQNAPRLG